MRIASTMMSHNYLKQLNGTYEQYAKLMEQSDGSRLHRASDDAVGYSKYLRYQNNKISNEQYQSNVKTAASWMNERLENCFTFWSSPAPFPPTFWGLIPSISPEWSFISAICSVFWASPGMKKCSS